MFGSEILDVAIGMVFVYLLLSLICSAVNEIIESWMKKRATDLERGLRELLLDYQGTGLVKEIYDHPLVGGLFRGDYNPTHLGHEALTGWLLRKLWVLPQFNIRRNAYRLRGLFLNRAGADLPSYIPSRNFSLALIDLIVRQWREQAGSPPSSPPAGSPPDSYVGAYTIEELREAVAAYAKNDEVRRALLPLVGTAGDLQKARESVERWYDSSMDRVSGWYKRRTQVILLFIGLGASVFINADTLAIFKSLMNDPPLRASLVAAAQEYAKANPTPPGGATPAPSPDPASPIKACQKDANSPECRVQQNQQQLEQLGLPTGWDCRDARALPQCVSFTPFSPNSWILWDTAAWSPWLFKLLGWMLTAVAVSLGAPFWFDLLNKFMVVRSTVKPHQKSPEEQSED
jgi:hypothetical protein